MTNKIAQGYNYVCVCVWCVGALRYSNYAYRISNHPQDKQGFGLAVESLVHAFMAGAGSICPQAADHVISSNYITLS